MFSHILTPLDGSPLAACVFPHVVAIARATGARITLLRVLERRGDSLAGHGNPFDWQMQKREAQTYLDEMAEQLLHTRVLNTGGNPCSERESVVRSGHATAASPTGHLSITR